jgi:mono/diheme cytochrome c family protein
MRADRLRTGFAAISAVALVIPAGAPVAVKAVEPRRIEGRAVAVQLCSSCHAIGHESQEASFVGPSFVRIANMKATTGLALNVFLQSHHQKMPSLRLDRDELDAVIDYILSLKSEAAVRP